ncbi:hypothetical protein SBOR_7497 [Sclerotinia borealis F-4128]|uniref:Methyltransferase type 11 domain-containing protein n=1 Tax=Sclerotinia borealis (strain F-4128) TaxID=1432307 RepID=W9C8J2_SCLBF|nr:hypothetical protein SBOR_7497 [Sclerotinia borealis F-4128]
MRTSDCRNRDKLIGVDLGCGPGTVSRALAPYFDKVLGTDPSAVMIERARAVSEDGYEKLDGDGKKNIEWKEATAENLQWIEKGSLDMVVAGQAAHWFNFSGEGNGVWGEIYGRLRRGGTVAFWGYRDNVLVDYPRATRVMEKFCYGEEREYMGGYWEQPGRDRLRGLYADEAMRPPREMFEDVRRVVYEPGSGVGEVLMRRKMKLGELGEYWRTFSAYFEWMRGNPERKRLGDGEGIGEEEGIGKGEERKGDVIDEMFVEMLEVEPELRGKEGQNWRDVEVETEWGTVILLARKL